MTREQAAEEYASTVNEERFVSYPIDGDIKMCFLAGCDWQAKQDEERIKELEEKLDAVEFALIHMPCKDWCSPENKCLKCEALSKIRGENGIK